MITLLLLLPKFYVCQSRVNDVPTSAEDGAVHIRVIAQQFAWNIHYPGLDGIFGETKVDLVDEEENPIGLDRSSIGGSDGK